MLLFNDKVTVFKELLSRYIVDFRDSIRLFEAFFFAYSKGVYESELDEFASQVRIAETRCNGHRRAVQNHLATGTFLPELRSDIFDLVERVNRVSSQMKEIVVFISTAYTSFPESLSGLFNEIVQRNIESVIILADALDLLLVDLRASIERAKTVEISESEIDTLERDMYRGIFREEGDTIAPGRKLLLKEFVCGVCAVSNRAEDAADRIELLAIKNWV